MHIWISENNNQGTLPSSSLILTKAASLAEQMGISNFTANERAKPLPNVLDMEDLKSFPPKTLTQILTLLKMFPFPAT